MARVSKPKKKGLPSKRKPGSAGKGIAQSGAVAAPKAAIGDRFDRIASAIFQLPKDALEQDERDGPKDRA